MPGDPTSRSLYFHESTKFFHDYRWIYDFKATRILCESVMQTVPPAFQEYLNSLDEASPTFRDILFLKESTDWPAVIQEFIAKCIRLKMLSEKLITSIDGTECSSLSTTVNESVSTSNLKLPKKWNPKKYFEVVHVGNYVGEQCKLENCDEVIDIGSGLGYLTRHIASQFEIPVIGMESDASRVKTATHEISEKAGSASTSQKFVCLRISENISEEIEPFVEGYNKVCITALHACGDLTPWSLKHFVNTSTCKMVAVVPCCYRKMSLDKDNFPLCSALKNELANYSDQNFLKNQWLWRLASQRSGNKFLNDIRKETNHLFYRAVVESICMKENLELRRRKRKLHDSNYETFDEYLGKNLGINGGFDLFQEDRKLNETELAEAIVSIKMQFERRVGWSCIITGILALQGAIQKIAEDMILIDRISFIEESNKVKESGIIKVIPDNVSPRGMVLVGVKK